MQARIRGSLVAALAVLLLALPAEAQRSVVRLSAGYGSVEAFRLGVSGSVGLRLTGVTSLPLLLTGRVAYFAGQELDLPQPIIQRQNARGEMKQLQLGGDVAWALSEYPVVLRLVLGGGVDWIAADASLLSFGESADVTRGYFSPGMIFGFSTGNDSFLGVEGRWMKVTDLEEAFLVNLTFGTELFR